MVCQYKQQICPPENLSPLMTLPVPDTFKLEYIPPSMETILANRAELGDENENQELVVDSDGTSVVNASGFALSRYDSTSQLVE